MSQSQANNDNKNQGQKEDFEAATVPDANYFYKQALYFIKKGDCRQAIVQFTLALQQKPDAVTIYHGRGASYNMIGERQKALADFYTYLKYDTTNPEVYLGITLAQRALGDFEKAHANLDQALKLRPSHAFYWNERGSLFIRQRKYKEAVDVIKQALLLEPDNDTYKHHLQFAETELKKGDWQEIAREVEKYLKLATNHRQKKDYNEAILAYLQVIKLDPQNVEANHQCGFILFSMGENARAIPFFNRIIEFNIQDVVAYINRSACYYNLRKYQEALKDAEWALQLDPNHYLAWFSRANAYSDLNQEEQALKDYERCIELKPDFGVAYFNRGVVYHNLKKHELALIDYTKAIELGYQDARVFDKRGSVNFVLKKYPESINDFSKTLELNPNDSRSYMFRGLAHQALGEFLEAIADYDQVVRLKPEDVKFKVYYQRSLCKFVLKEYDSALTDINQALALNPDEREYQKFRKAIYQKLQAQNEGEQAG